MNLVSVRLVREPEYDYSANISSPQAAVEWVKDQTKDLSSEAVYLLCLSSDMKVTNATKLSSGGMSASYVDIREVMKTALLSNAAHIMLVHNHPTGKLVPSSNDWDVAKALKDAGNIMGIDLVDSIIVGYTGYYSMKSQVEWAEKMAS